MFSVVCEFCRQNTPTLFVARNYPSTETEQDDDGTEYEYKCRKDRFVCPECFDKQDFEMTWEGILEPPQTWHVKNNFFPYRAAIQVLDWLDDKTSHGEWIIFGIPDEKFANDKFNPWRFRVFCWYNSKICSWIGFTSWWTC